MARLNQTVLATLTWSVVALGCSASTSEDPGTTSAGGISGSGGTLGAAGTVAGGGSTVGGASGAAGSSVSGGAGAGGTGGALGGGGAGGASTGGGGVGGTTGGGGTGGAGGGGGGGAGGGPSLDDLDPFSFFVTSQVGLIALAPDANGFGGDLRFGEATGLAGADKICTTLAESSMPGSGAKQWRAFLSTTAGGENDGPINAIDRIGTGPWYDRNGRLFANDVAGLIGTRPDGDPQAVEDFANELGEPNHSPGGVTV
ncbi:MAG TPA: hypothetical protein VHO25_08465, partial [Polyangiaceae bacterium]|nr:hypothetical protein [Polyangiaceae bacterium]